MENSQTMSLQDKRLLLIITGGVAAYKCLDLIRRLKERGMQVRTILTKSGSEFVTPLSISALSGETTYQDLFSLKDETEMGHIRLSREADLVLVAPATANIIAKMATGQANDIATTTLLATDKDVMIAPAMNHMMWHHKATQRNLKRLKEDGVHIIPPASGELACGEVGDGRLADIEDIISTIEHKLSPHSLPLKGYSALITAGPTHEPIDPVRYIANRSSGKQGYALAASLAKMGAKVTLISGPTHLNCPEYVTRINVETAKEMLEQCQLHLPADIMISVAAVADWRVKNTQQHKIKKDKDAELPHLTFEENPDILQTISQLTKDRPPLVIGFAAETDQVLDHATQKRKRKGCDWIIANDVSTTDDGQCAMGGDKNQATLITDKETVAFDLQDKAQLSDLITTHIITYFRDRK